MFRSGCSGSLARDRDSPWCGRGTLPLKRGVGGSVSRMAPPDLLFFFTRSLPSKESLEKPAFLPSWGSLCWVPERSIGASQPNSSRSASERVQTHKPTTPSLTDILATGAPPWGHPPSAAVWKAYCGRSWRSCDAASIGIRKLKTRNLLLYARSKIRAEPILRGACSDGPSVRRAASA